MVCELRDCNVSNLGPFNEIAISKLLEHAVERPMKYVRFDLLVCQEKNILTISRIIEKN